MFVGPLIFPGYEILNNGVRGILYWRLKGLTSAICLASREQTELVRHSSCGDASLRRRLISRGGISFQVRLKLSNVMNVCGYIRST